MCQIWLRSDGSVEKKGDRQTDKGTLQLYIVDVVTTIFIGILLLNIPFDYENTDTNNYYQFIHLTSKSHLDSHYDNVTTLPLTPNA